MDVATVAALLGGVAALTGTVVAFLGKRGENALNGYTNLTGDLQEERDGLKVERADLQTKLAELHSQRAADQAEIARLHGIITRLGGEP